MLLLRSFMSRSPERRNRFLASLGLQLKQRRPFNSPTHLFLEVTNRCNLACVMCGRTHDARHDDPSFLGDMTLATAQRLDDFYPASSFVTATGLGEPFLNPEFLPILRHLKTRGATVSFTSNGTLIDEEAARAVIDTGVDRIVFSIDSPDARTFEQIRVGGRLEPIIANLERLSQLRAAARPRLPYLILEFVAMARNFHQLPQLGQLAVRLGFDEVIVQNLFSHFAPGYDTFYRKNRLAALDPGQTLQLWAEFEQQLAASGIALYSPFQDGGIRSYLGEKKQQESVPRLRTRSGFLGYIDEPESLARVADQLLVSGWALGREGFPQVEICLESGTETVQKQVSATVERPDVAPHLPSDFPGLSLCGFAEQLDVSTLEPGVYTLSLRVWSGERGATLSRRQVVIRDRDAHRMYCSQPWSTIFVSWDGKVRTCCFNEFVLGDLNSQSGRQIWRGDNYRELRRRVADGDVLSECADCLAGKSNPDYIRPLSWWLRSTRH